MSGKISADTRGAIAQARRIQRETEKCLEVVDGKWPGVHEHEIIALRNSLRASVACAQNIRVTLKDPTVPGIARVVIKKVRGKRA